MKKFKLFLLGVVEFRKSTTTNVNEEDINTYDWGREIAHRLTFRIFEP